MNDIIPQTLIIFLFTSVVVTVRVRRPIRLRPPPDQIASAARLGCVRRPVRLRPPSDQIASAVRSDCVRVTMTFAKELL